MAVSAQSADWQLRCQTSSYALYESLTAVERVFVFFELKLSRNPRAAFLYHHGTLDGTLDGKIVGVRKGS